MENCARGGTITLLADNFELEEYIRLKKIAENFANTQGKGAEWAKADAIAACAWDAYMKTQKKEF